VASVGVGAVGVLVKKVSHAARLAARGSVTRATVAHRLISTRASTHSVQRERFDKLIYDLFEFFSLVLSTFQCILACRDSPLL